MANNTSLPQQDRDSFLDDHEPFPSYEYWHQEHGYLESYVECLMRKSWDQGFQEGLVEGKIEGIAEGQAHLISRMKQYGLGKEAIMDIIG